MYAEMDNEGKRAMAKKYVEHGGKDLTWSATYFESNVVEDITEKSTRKGMMTRKQILDLEGIDVSEMDNDTKNECLQELLKKLWDRLKMNPESHPQLIEKHKIEAMNRYYYEHVDQKDTELNKNSQELSVQAAGIRMDTAQKMITNRPSDPNVKIENMWHVDLMAKVKPVWQAKAKLERDEATLKDILCEFENAVEGKKGFKEIVQDYESKMEVLHEFLSQLRKAYAQVNKIEASDEGTCTTALSEWTTFGEAMLVHQQGVKQMMSGMRAFL